MKTAFRFHDFLLLIGKSVDLFDYFKTDSIAGLKREKCFDSKESTYIAGLCNEYNEPFIYLNSEVLKSEDRTDLVYHESFHHALRHYDIELENEESIVEFACETAKRIMEKI